MFTRFSRIASLFMKRNPSYSAHLAEISNYVCKFRETTPAWRGDPDFDPDNEHRDSVEDEAKRFGMTKDEYIEAMSAKVFWPTPDPAARERRNQRRRELYALRRDAAKWRARRM